MSHPRYFVPGTLIEALSTLAECIVGMPLAGGTDLTPAMRAGQCCPEALIDLRRLPLRSIVARDASVEIGACVTHRQIAKGGPCLADYPALRLACREVGSSPIQNRGTLGGNLCNASPAADTAPALLIYDAEVRLASACGQRTVPLATFFRGPGSTILAPGELLTEILLPAPLARTTATFFKQGRRQAMAIALVSVAVRLTLEEDGTIAQARVALGSVGPTPLRAAEAEAILTGCAISQEPICEAALAASRECSPISDIRASAAYRRRMVEVQTRRTLESLWRTLRTGEATRV